MIGPWRDHADQGAMLRLVAALLCSPHAHWCSECYGVWGCGGACDETAGEVPCPEHDGGQRNVTWPSKGSGK